MEKPRIFGTIYGVFTDLIPAYRYIETMQPALGKKLKVVLAIPDSTATVCVVDAEEDDRKHDEWVRLHERPSRHIPLHASEASQLSIIDSRPPYRNPAIAAIVEEMRAQRERADGRSPDMVFVMDAAGYMTDEYDQAEELEEGEGE